MNCSACGCDLVGDAVFCKRCGAPVASAGPIPGPRVVPPAAAAPQPEYGAPVYGTGSAAYAGGFGAGSVPYPAYAKMDRFSQRRLRVRQNVQPLGITWILSGVYRFLAGITAAFAMHRWEDGWMGLHHGFWPTIALSGSTMAALCLVTGYGLLTAKPWARGLAIGMGIVSLFKVPIGTGVGIYTLWVLKGRTAGEEYGRMVVGRSWKDVAWSHSSR